MIIEKNTIEDAKMNEVAMYSLRNLASRTTKLGSVLPNGWHFILQSEGEAIEQFKLSVTADNGGGSFAEAKLKTLIVQPDLLATGQSPKELIPVVENMIIKTEDQDEALAMLNSHSDLDSLSKSEETFLRDTTGVTGFAGGVRLPFTALDYNDSKPTEGAFLISFSGGSSEQDLYFGLSVFYHFIEQYRKTFPTQNIHLLMDGHKKHPAVDFWLYLLSMHEF